MYKTFLAAILLFTTLPVHAATPDWNKRLAAAMPLLGHRNWILVVDSAYPLQTGSGIETIETNATQLEVARAVLGEIENSIQVRPIVYMDAELPFVSDSDVPGASSYRSEIASFCTNIQPSLCRTKNSFPKLTKREKLSTSLC